MEVRTPPIHILVVDDDRETCELLRQCLESSGFRISTARSGDGMRRTLRETRVDLVVLDVMMPGDDGLTLCREIRMTSYVPIIMLTALADDVDRIVGIDAGADDYMIKPYSPRELLARIRAVLRRSARIPHEPQALEARGYRFGSWRLETASRTLIHSDGTSRTLPAAEFRLLSLLLAAPTRMLTRAELLPLLRRRDGEPFDRSLDARICRLRRILREDARSPQIIKTIYGEGYVFGVPVEMD
jgi:two-component system OmpR family response regulator